MRLFCETVTSRLITWSTTWIPFSTPQFVIIKRDLYLFEINVYCFFKPFEIVFVIAILHSYLPFLGYFPDWSDEFIFWSILMDPKADTDV